MFIFIIIFILCQVLEFIEYFLELFDNIELQNCLTSFSFLKRKAVKVACKAAKTTSPPPILFLTDSQFLKVNGIKKCFLLKHFLSQFFIKTLRKTYSKGFQITKNR